MSRAWDAYHEDNYEELNKWAKEVNIVNKNQMDKEKSVMSRITLEGDLKIINDSVLKQAFEKTVEAKRNTTIEGKNYTLKITVGVKHKKAYIEKNNNHE